MKKALLVFAVLAQASFASYLVVNPVPVSGGGMYAGDSTDCGWSFQASGSNGKDSVSIRVNYESPVSCRFGSAPIFSSNIQPLSTWYATSSATIDAISSNYFGFALGNGSGHLDINDSTGLVLASANLVDWILVTSYSGCCSTYYLGDNATFSFLSTPEPGTWVLLLLAVPGMILKRPIVRASLRVIELSTWAHPTDSPVETLTNIGCAIRHA